ncbi:class I SAM-dependent rRNA methyltransferase [Longimicrobium sp.]|uniref:class I SAM-dependent rRNA methyltransferase n=1 Tax=Longimicrobium sp. TaxID=2029185 RepID=UPI002C36121A|nr:class I SAM-dependent rRNA methyltransferase [Longimicrobium sp.]HSU15951.1 class I SAM-dependent rRNA methyltransferase [Longimicrobium sp.]
MSLPPLRLRKNEDRRLRAGHLWVFSNEIDVERTPLPGFEPGEMVEVQDARGAPLGVGYVNPRSLIAARLVSRDRDARLDRALLKRRLARALSLREMLFDRPFYRLAYGESDGVPGLVADRFGDHVVVQLTTAGMERAKDDVVQALRDTLQPAGILFRNDSSGRALEGLDTYVETAFGEVPAAVPLEENGVRFEAPVAGQKTGWFYDHRMNRARLMAYARGRRVLDVFSYIGGWGVQAAAAGAEHVVCVDASAEALEHVARNAALNGAAERVSTRKGDAFDVLRMMAAEGEKFDVVVLDPPAFIKRRKDQKAGEEAYRRVNQLALEVLRQDGILVSASCSYHLPREALQDAMLRAARNRGRSLQIVEQGHQGPDHPVHPAIPETAYLKAFFGRVG